ncbi:Holliday junction branch migration protein RuvA [Roseospira visakhapatnamensis]|uniref:Holliday junction branch migration complex subunit RuvA n=1 Tax=Roseospira visakhapatnamensis TaxID=390880 RepID=A0A7W6W8N1_9PROT|nr:Holliday junction branch migration protein RuvA [Roseospira visakhapatnamensis]MBB4264993.1 Holliday junction DNA helicase RuvA [Roseospira visakhapatnamensis]
MIAALRGRVDAVGDDWAVIDVQGVGYLVFCSARTLGRLPAPGAPDEARLLVETHVREDHIHLYGFAETLERDAFRLLGTVQGVGAKVALAILSVVPADRLGGVLAAQDKAAIQRASGVGPKLAARILSELKDKATSLGAVPGPRPAGVAPPDGPAPVVSAATTGDARAALVEDATSALVNLGYRRLDAWEAAAQATAALGDAATVERVLGAALKALGQQ